MKPFLVLEWLRPGEGQDKATLRLLARLPELYGSRFFDLLLLDSLYAQAAVLKLAEQIGWDVVISLKQEKRDLYQDVLGLFQTRAPNQVSCYPTRLSPPSQHPAIPLPNQKTTLGVAVQPSRPLPCEVPVNSLCLLDIPWPLR